MSNKWNYNEAFMHAQNQPEWANNKMLPSNQTIGAKGCFISCLTYIRSRKEFGYNVNYKGYEIPDQVKLMSAHRGFDMAGNTIWAAAKNHMGLRIERTRSVIDAALNRLPFVMRNVWVRGSGNAMFSHWVVELRGNLCYDPLRSGGNFVHSLDEFVPVYNSSKRVNRRFIG